MTASQSRSRLRIAMCSPQFHPIVGGYERAAERLSAALAARGHSVTVLTARRERAWPATEAMSGFTVRRLAGIARPGLYTLSLALSHVAYFVFHGRRFDIVHGHQAGLLGGIAVAMGWASGSKTVMKLTSTGAGGIGTVLAGPSLQARVLRWAHRLLDGVVVTSADAETEARNFFGPRTRLCRIPNGIEIERFVLPPPAEKAEVRRQLDLGDGPVALYVGRLHPDKNILGLLDAWRTVAARMPDARLAVIGDGPQQDAAHARAAELDIQGSVIFCGELRDVRPWYQAADVFVLPSIFEGLSNSLIEAMSSGLAVVSTDVSGSRDVFAAVDIGAMVGDDMQQFAAALIALFEDEERRAACGRRARAYAEATFSLDVVAHRTEEFYATLLAAPVAS